MRAVLDAAPEQAMTPPCGVAFHRRRPRIAATKVRTYRTPQTVIVAGIGEIVTTFRIRRDRQIILVRRQIKRTAAAPATHHLRRDQLLIMLIVRTVE